MMTIEGEAQRAQRTSQVLPSGKNRPIPRKGGECVGSASQHVAKGKASHKSAPSAEVGSTRAEKAARKRKTRKQRKPAKKAEDEGVGNRAEIGGRARGPGREARIVRAAVDSGVEESKSSAPAEGPARGSGPPSAPQAPPPVPGKGGRPNRRGRKGKRATGTAVVTSVLNEMSQLKGEADAYKEKMEELKDALEEQHGSAKGETPSDPEDAPAPIPPIGEGVIVKAPKSVWLFVGCPPCLGLEGPAISLAGAPLHRSVLAGSNGAPVLWWEQRDVSSVTSFVEENRERYKVVGIVIHSFSAALVHLDEILDLDLSSAQHTYIFPQDVVTEWQEPVFRVSYDPEYLSASRRDDSVALRVDDEQLPELEGAIGADVARPGQYIAFNTAVPRTCLWGVENRLPPKQGPITWLTGTPFRLVSCSSTVGFEAMSMRVVKAYDGQIRLSPSRFPEHSLVGMFVDRSLEDVTVPAAWLRPAMTAALFAKRDQETFTRVLNLVKSAGESLVRSKQLKSEIYSKYVLAAAWYCMLCHVEEERALAKSFGMHYRSLSRLNAAMRLGFASEYNPTWRLLKRVCAAITALLLGMFCGKFLGSRRNLPSAVRSPLLRVAASLAGFGYVWYKTRPAADLSSLVAGVRYCQPQESLPSPQVKVNALDVPTDKPAGFRAGPVPRVPPQRFTNTNVCFNELVVQRIDTATEGPSVSQCVKMEEVRTRWGLFDAIGSSEELQGSLAHDFSMCSRLNGSQVPAVTTVGGPDAGWFVPVDSRWWLENQCRPAMRHAYGKALDVLENNFGYPLLEPCEVPDSWLMRNIFIKGEWAIPKDPEDWTKGKPRGITSVEPKTLMMDVGPVYSASWVCRWLLRPFHKESMAESYGLAWDSRWTDSTPLPWVHTDSGATHLLYAPGLVPRALSDWTVQAKENLSALAFEARGAGRYAEVNLEAILGRMRDWELVAPGGEDSVRERLREILRPSLSDNDPVILCADASSWEYCYNTEMMSLRKGGFVEIDGKPHKFKHWLADLFGKHTVLEKRRLCEWALKAQFITTATTIAGSRKRRGMRGKEMYTIYRECERRVVNSGESDTTVLNSLDNLLLYRCMAEILGLPLETFYVAVAGDDSFNVCLQKDARLFSFLLSLDVFGFNFKKGDNVKIVSFEESWRADFCSMRLWPNGPSWEWGPMPERLLLKTFHVPTDTTTLAEQVYFASTVAEGLMGFCNILPVFQGLLLSLVEVGSRRPGGSLTKARRRYLKTKVGLETGDWKPSRGATAFASSAAMEEFSRRYPELNRWLLDCASNGYRDQKAEFEKKGFFFFPQVVEDELRAIQGSL